MKLWTMFLFPKAAEAIKQIGALFEGIPYMTDDHLNLMIENATQRQSRT